MIGGGNRSRARFEPLSLSRAHGKGGGTGLLGATFGSGPISAESRLKGAQNTELHPEEPLQPLRSHVSWCPQRSACHRRQLLRATATRTGYLGRAKSGGLSRENPAGEPVQGAGRERPKAIAHGWTGDYLPVSSPAPPPSRT